MSLNKPLVKQVAPAADSASYCYTPKTNCKITQGLIHVHLLCPVSAISYTMKLKQCY